MNKNQILAALSPLYRQAYDEFYDLKKISEKYFNEGKDKEYTDFKERASDEYRFLNGVIAAARALGINFDELVWGPCLEETK